MSRQEFADDMELVRHVLNTVFGGNQSKMAAAIGIGQPAISRAISGKSRPGTKLLNAIAAHPDVDAAWFPTGRKRPSPSATPPTKPRDQIALATALLPGAPGDNTSLLSTQMQLVPPASFRESLYAIAAKRCRWKEPADGESILPDDVLIIETDRRVWESNSQLLDDRLCVMRDRTNDRDALVLSNFNNPVFDSSHLKKNEIGELARYIDTGQEREQPNKPSAEHVFGLVLQLIRDF